jgi:hypothetical protein
MLMNAGAIKSTVTPALTFLAPQGKVWCEKICFRKLCPWGEMLGDVTLWPSCLVLLHCHPMLSTILWKNELWKWS